MIKLQENIWWNHVGTLSDFTFTPTAGCYIFVWDKKRIIYVGASSDIGQRLVYHKEAIRAGKRPIWKVDKDEDIYDLMKSLGSNRKGKLTSMAQQELIWVNYERNSECTNLLNAEDNFETNWKEYVINEFLPKIDVWATGINGHKEYAAILESRLQVLLKKAFNLGSFSGKFNQSWLGKIEHPLISNRITFNFQNLPAVDQATLDILACINDSYLETLISTKRGLRKKKTKVYNDNPDKIIYRIKKSKVPIDKAQKSVNRYMEDLKTTRTKFKFYKTRWTVLEDNVLKFLLEKKVPISKISTELSRTPGEIQARIIKLKIVQ